MSSSFLDSQVKDKKVFAASFTNEREPNRFAFFRVDSRLIISDLRLSVATGKLKLRIGHVYKLEEVQQAHRDLEGRKTTGKILLVP
ncbi:MAG: zinc-binding dehydrogenase [Candidatus Angelobacter sp.]